MPLILGADRSGKSLVSAMLNCSKDIRHQDVLTDILSYKSFEQKQLRLLDILHKQNTNQKYIWLIRNPLESACSISKNAGISEQKALTYWADINTIIWYFLESVASKDKIYTKFEQILLMDLPIKKIFQFCELEYNKQYLYYGDFVQFNFDDPFFRKGNREGEKVNCYEYNDNLLTQWNSIKNQETIIQFGYTRSEKWE